MTTPIALEIAAGPLRGKQPAIQSGLGLRFDQETIALQQPARLWVGRALDCQICLPPDDDQVSRHHFQLEVGPHGVRVRDGGSRNGTFVNGRPLVPDGAANVPGRCARSAPVELQDGDCLLAGRTVFCVRIGGSRVRDQQIERPVSSAVLERPAWDDSVPSNMDADSGEIPAPANASACLFRRLLQTTGLIERAAVLA